MEFAAIYHVPDDDPETLEMIALTTDARALQAVASAVLRRHEVPEVEHPLISSLEMKPA